MPKVMFPLVLVAIAMVVAWKIISQVRDRSQHLESNLGEQLPVICFSGMLNTRSSPYVVHH
jgi:hypothetical protein